jgi:hypothetical protein
MASSLDSLTMPEDALLHPLNDGNVAVVIATSRYTLAELEAAVDVALAHTAENGQVSGLLVDYTSSDILPERSVDDLQATGHFYSVRGARYGARLALIASSNLGYDLLRMIATHTERHGVTSAVFREYASAIEWLHETLRPMQLQAEIMGRSDTK